MTCLQVFARIEKIYIVNTYDVYFHACKNAVNDG